MKLQLFFLGFFQLFASLLLSIYQRLRFIIIYPKLGSVPRMRQISSDILLDIADFLIPKQRQQLLLVNRQFLITIERGMQKFWFTEEFCISNGDLMIDKRNVLTYQANLDQLFGKRNLFLRIRLRLVENVEAGELGRGDALILAAEYRPLNGGENKEAILANENTRHDDMFIWEYFKKRIGAWKSSGMNGAVGRKNDLKQFERRLLISSGNLMRGKTHRLQMMGNTLQLKCRLKMEDQRWKNEDKLGEYNKFMKFSSPANMMNPVTAALASSFVLEDSFTYEILRSSEICWPKPRTINRPMPVRKEALKFWNGFCGRNFYEDTSFIRPICHLEIVGDDITFMMDCNDLLETRKGEKTSINKDEIGFHICAEQIICRYNNDFCLKYYLHRLIRIPREIDENSWTWTRDRWFGLFTAKAKLKN